MKRMTAVLLIVMVTSMLLPLLSSCVSLKKTKSENESNESLIETTDISTESSTPSTENSEMPDDTLTASFVESDLATGISLGMTEEEAQTIIQEILDWKRKPLQSLLFNWKFPRVRDYILSRTRTYRKVEGRAVRYSVTTLIHIDPDTKTVDSIEQLAPIQDPGRDEFLDLAQLGMSFYDLITLVGGPIEAEEEENGELSLIFPAWDYIDIDVKLDSNDTVTWVHPHHECDSVEDHHFGYSVSELMTKFEKHSNQSPGIEDACYYFQVGQYYLFSLWGSKAMRLAKVDPETMAVVDSRYYNQMHGKKRFVPQWFSEIRLGMCIYEVVYHMGMPENEYSDNHYIWRYPFTDGITYCIEFDTEMNVIDIRKEPFKGHTIFFKITAAESSQAVYSPS